MYSDKLPFPMPHLTVGLVVELIDLRQCIQDIIDDNEGQPIDAQDVLEKVKYELESIAMQTFDNIIITKLNNN